MSDKRATENKVWAQLQTFAESKTGMPVLGKRLLYGGDTDLKKKAEVAFEKLLKDVLTKAQDT